MHDGCPGCVQHQPLECPRDDRGWVCQRIVGLVPNSSARLPDPAEERYNRHFAEIFRW